MAEPRIGDPLRRYTVALLNTLIVCLFLSANAIPAPPAATLVAHLQGRLGLNDRQARGALGALLVYAQQRLPKSDFKALSQRVPNADRIMQDIKLQGVVTGPLDDIEEYERALGSLGIGQPLASQIAPAVLEYLGATGHDLERDILSGILD